MSNSKMKPRTHAERMKWPMRVDLTAKECVAERFSGIRKVEITGEIEIWMLGHLRHTITQAEITMHLDAIERALAKICGLD